MENGMNYVYRTASTVQLRHPHRETKVNEMSSPCYLHRHRESAVVDGHTRTPTFIVTAKLLSSTARICRTAPPKPSTSTGSNLGLLSAKPNCPKSFAPQAYTRPPRVRASSCWLPSWKEHVVRET